MFTIIDNDKSVSVGETSVKRTPSKGAVVSYAEYSSIGAVLPLQYDETVLTRWGVDIMVGSPVITVTAARASVGECNKNLVIFLILIFLSDLSMSCLFI